MTGPYTWCTDHRISDVSGGIGAWNISHEPLPVFRWCCQNLTFRRKTANRFSIQFPQVLAIGMPVPRLFDGPENQKSFPHVR